MSDNETLHFARAGSSARSERAQALVLPHRLVITYHSFQDQGCPLPCAASLFLFRLGTQTAISCPGCIRLTSNQCLYFRKNTR